MAWVMVIVAGLFETVFAVSLKLSEGFRHVGWTVSFVLAAVVSFSLLSTALRTLPVGSAYAVWVGIGAVLTAVIGMIAFKDPVNTVTIGSIALIIAGVVGLQLAGSGH